MENFYIMLLYCPMLKTQIGMKNVSFGMNETNKWNYMPTTHAEVSAYMKIKGYKNIKNKLDLFVIRITKGGKLSESRPCFHCIDILHKSHLNIVNVYYSTTEGTIVCEKFKNMILHKHIHISKGYKRYVRK